MSRRFAARRRPRSMRSVAAVLLVAGAAALVLVGLVTGAAPVLALAAVVSVVAGGGAGRVVVDELRDERLQHSRDRAVQARRFTQLLAEGSAQHVDFIRLMSQRVGERERDV